MSELKGEYEKIVKEAVRLLDDNNEWRCHYKRYIKNFNDNKKYIRDAFRKFGPTPKLNVYLPKNKADAAGKNTVFFDLRYRGEKVAELTIGKEPTFTISDKIEKFEEYNSKLPDLSKKRFNWKGDDGEKFRKFFADNPKQIKAGNIKESQLEAQLLENFSKTSFNDKLLAFIQPVKLFCGFFQFPSALPGCKASDGTVEYSPDPSGHIDILVRKGRGINTKLTIIELKRKYDKPEQAVKQAIVYAVFMQRLLRCADADNIKWWKFLGFYREKTEDEIKDILEKRPIRIQAVIAMPSSKQNKTDFIDELDIPNGQGKNDKIILHYLYFNHDEDGIITDIVETSLK